MPTNPGFEMRSGKVVLLGQPDYCCTIAGFDSPLPSRCNDGRWLIYNRAVWSTPDILFIAHALEIANTLAGRISLAIRPFESFDQLHVHGPVVDENCVSPVWVFRIDGTTAWYMSGNQPIEELISRILEG